MQCLSSAPAGNCSAGYSSIASLGAWRCFRLGDSSHVEQANNKQVSSTLTANKICLKEGARLATPLSVAERDAMMMFARDSRDAREEASQNIDLRVYSGLQYFKQSDLTTGREAEDGFISAWSDRLVSKAEGQAALGSFFTESMKCLVMRYQASTASTATLDWEASDCVDSQQAGEERRVLALCEQRPCPGCVFPFSLAGRTYSTCVRLGSPDLSPWCSTKVDEAPSPVLQAVPSLTALWGSEVTCPPPTCLQESVSTPEDNPTSVSRAVEECLGQGGRLYQPRSVRSLEAAKLFLPRV